MTRKLLLLTAGMAALAACTTEAPAPTETAQPIPPSRPAPQLEDRAKMSSLTSAGFAEMAYADIAMEPPARDTSRFDNGDDNPVKRVAEEPVSTFSADVDTTSYAVMRRYLSQGSLPPSEAVRTEEFLNYFDYDYTAGSKNDPFTATVWVTPSPWNGDTELLHIGVKGYDPEPAETPDANIVLLLDISGSMKQDDKLPLLKKAMGVLVDQMGPDDRISIVTYAGGTGVALAPTPGDERVKIMGALENLSAGGSTAGAAGLSLAYDLAEQNFDKDKINRIILATDGDFNVGITGDESLEDLVARKRQSGVYLSVLGFGMGNLNDTMMQRIAQNGNGVAAYIDTMDEARKVLGREFRSSVFPIAEDLKFQVEFNPAQVSEYRLIGYQTRILDREDFNNDAVDAGDIGSGHTVTALYEITRTGKTGSIDPLRYGDEPAPAADPSAELAFLKIRYKRPGEDNSHLITRAITPDDVVERLDQASDDARFAAAVAAMGEKLSRTDQVEGMSWDTVIDLALKARGDDPYGDRVGFVNLARAAKDLDAGVAGE